VFLRRGGALAGPLGVEPAFDSVAQRAGRFGEALLVLVGRSTAEQDADAAVTLTVGPRTGTATQSDSWSTEN